MLSHTSKHTAFTLLEVLIVLLILGALATLSIPQFEGMQRKAQFAKVLGIVSRIEREMDYIIVEQGWSFNPFKVQEQLGNVLTGECGLAEIGGGGLYTDADAKLIYSVSAESSAYMILNIDTSDPSGDLDERITLCTRLYIGPDLGGDGSKYWTAYKNNPWYKDIRGLLKGQVHD